MTTQPIIIPIADSGDDRYELVESFRWAWHADGAAWRIEVPKGFRLDGASVPGIATALTGIGRDGLHRAAALVHDFLYRHGGRPPHGSFTKLNVAAADWLPCAAPWTREQVDKLFANMLAAAGVSKLRRRLMYLAVRAVGWRSWRTLP